MVGAIYDRYGPSRSTLGGALVILGSYATIQAIVNHTITASPSDDTGLPTASFWVLKLAFFGVGFGSALGYLGGLASTAQQFTSFPNHSSRAVACVATGYGLSSTLVGLTYEWLGGGGGDSSSNGGGIKSFFGVLAVIVASVYALASLAFWCKSRKNNAGSHRDPEAVSLTTEDSGNDGDDEGNGSSNGGDGNDASLLSEPSPVTNTTWNNWKRSEFWWLFLAFGFITGSGLLVINNVSIMAQSIGASDQYAGTLVVVLGLANASGRILTGTIGDLVGKSHRVHLFQALQVIMAVGLLASAVAGDHQHGAALAVTVVLTTMAYGGSYVVIVSVLTDTFGDAHFGKDYGLVCMVPALSGYAFNTLAAYFYEKYQDDDTSVCLGPLCYQTTFLLTGLFTGIVGCLALWPVARKSELTRY